MATSPPFSPTPRRWRSPQSEHHPDFAALLTSFENTSSTSHSRESSRTRSDESRRDQAEFRTAPTSPTGLFQRDVPEIRAISPSPQRPIQQAVDMTSQERVGQRSADFEANQGGISTPRRELVGFSESKDLHLCSRLIRNTFRL